MSPTYTRGMTRFSRSIWGNPVKIPRISQMPNSQRHTSQVGFKLFPDQSGAIKSRFRESLKDAKKQSGACIQVNLNLFPINMGHCLEPMITRGISPIVYISQSPREANLSKVPTNWGKSMQVQFDILTNTQ